MLCSIDEGNISVLTMLDLSAAFDTIDHDIILLDRLFYNFGIQENALKLIRTYLQDRYKKLKLIICTLKTFLFHLGYLRVVF